ncbi:MAG: DUF6794 domain-containing protein [Mariniphaga sp.]
MNIFVIYGQKINQEFDRYNSDSIKGVYIPKDLEDCFNQIDSFWNDSTKQVVKGWNEAEFSVRIHMGFGMWMRNNWQLWGGSRLSKYFNDKGIFHPDDMSGIILNSYHRHLTNSEIKLEEQIQFYKEYWEKSKQVEIDRTTTKFIEYKIGDTVLFNYPYGFSRSKQETKYDNDRCIAKGKILEKDTLKFMLKILLIEDCSKKGIIYYSDAESFIYDKESNTWQQPKKTTKKYLKKGGETWFYYDNWDLN